MTIGPGTRLGPYEILSLLGRGGMGEVYRGRDTRLQRDIAIKTLPPAVAGNPIRHARLEREAQTISQLSHPNICAIYDIGEEDGVAFLVMEYVDGQTLADRLRLGPIPWQTALPWAIDIASAIDAAHRRGIVHRDLKPANIMTGESGIKLLDFGIAKLVEQSDAACSAVTASLTSEQQIVGTVHYMAPEQLEGREVDQRTDIFAFGATLYELLTGRRAFDGASAASVTAAILTSEPAPLSPPGATEMAVPRALDHVVRRALAKDPANRWQTARDLMIELQSIQARTERGLPTDTAQQPSSGSAVRRSLWSSPRLIAAGVALAAVVAAGSWYVTRDSSITLAVVPLEAVTGIADTDTLDDGITEAIINKLRQATPKRLKVIALSSVRRYKGQKFDAHSAGEEMGASMILTLRITPQPENVSIGLELVRASDGTVMWGGKYNTSLSNLFANEDLIAIRTLEQLQIELNEEEKRRLSKRYTENLDAYREYLNGWRLADRQAGTEVNYEQSLEFFQKAIDIDPNYALAFVGKAGTYTGMGFEGFLPPQEARTRALDAIAKANDLDASIVEGSSVVGAMEMFQWHLDRAIAAFQNALRMNPYDPILHKSSVFPMRATGRWSEAIAAGESAVRLDPRGVQSNADLGTTYSWKGDLERAIDQYGKTLALDPKAATVHELLADVYARAGKYDQAIAEMRQALSLAGPPGEPIAAALGADFVTFGYDVAMKHFYQGQLEASLDASKAGEYVSPMYFAQVYAGLRDVNKTFEFLRKAFDERHPWLAFLKYDPTFELLRADPRFLALVHDVGIPEPSRFREFLRRLGLPF
jgi:eukaryotic-like serine/threonine-protein kinase